METKLNNKHILLWAEDDADDLLFIREALKHTGDKHEIVEADNGRKALDYLSAIDHPSEFPCLIVLDINMPVLNGRELLAIIKSEERFSSIPIVVFTTSSSEADRLFCKRFGVEVFTKPLCYEAFKKVVLQLLSYCQS